MDRCAVFIDAGYLLSEGGKAFCGVRKRSLVVCDYAAIVREIEGFCCALHGLPSLRLYWYDGASDAMPTGDHVFIASLPRVKLRLGRLSGGKQKGVDSLIVHDLITLAHERAVASMYLLGGDEDLREGVAAAQRLGVQVCLLGLDAGIPNQSQSLIAEADEHVMLPGNVLQPLFQTTTPATRIPVPEAAGGDDRVEDLDVAAQAALDASMTVATTAAERFAATWLAGVTHADVAELLVHKPRIPLALDVQLLMAAERELGASLRQQQPLKHAVRAAFWDSITAAAPEGSATPE